MVLLRGSGSGSGSQRSDTADTLGVQVELLASIIQHRAGDGDKDVPQCMALELCMYTLSGVVMVAASMVSDGD